MDASLGYARRLSVNRDILSGIDLSQAEIEEDDKGFYIRLDKFIDNKVSRRTSLTPNVRKSSVTISTIYQKQDVSTYKASDETKIERDDWKLLYKVSESPPFYMTLLFAFQLTWVISHVREISYIVSCIAEQVLMVLPSCVMSAIMVAQAVCAENDNELKTQLLTTTSFLSAVCTIVQTTFGVRLPVFQGPTVSYIVPILVLANLPDWKCEPIWNKVMYNATTEQNMTTDELDIIGYREKVVLPKLQQMQGSLILAGGLHMLMGLTGFVGVLLKVVGPLSVVPTLLLLAIELYGVMNNFCEPHWPIAAGTFLLTMILAVYLNGWQMPLPMYTRSKGCRIIRYPLHQVLSIMIAILIGWAVCGILTYADVFTDDPNNLQYKSRTDYGYDAIERTPWFTIPYPGQFGSIGFSGGIFISFFIATLLLIIESIANYYACARLSHLPPPPISAMNRGIMMEGLMSMIAGFFGAAHATITYSTNIGLIAMTKVASRRVFQMLGVQLLLCSILGKFGAVFVTIPYPVLGGAAIISFGLFIGVVISYLQFVDMNSPRNLAVLGVSMITGLMVPNWVKKNVGAVNTGNPEFDNFLLIALTNPSLFGGLLAFILDNTIKGTKQERGIATWSMPENQQEHSRQDSEEGFEVYEIPFLTKHLDKLPFMKYLPVFPTFKRMSLKCRPKSINISENGTELK